MPKQAISVTLDTDNLTWLRGRTSAAGIRSVSELLDRLVTAARQGGRVGPSRSVVGTIDIDEGDRRLERADAAVTALFGASVGRPLRLREPRTRYRARPPAKKTPRG